MTWCNFHFPGWARLRVEHPELLEEVRNKVSRTFEVDEHLNFTMYAHHGDALPLNLSSGTVLSQDPACPDNSPLIADGRASAGFS
jgi:hypothetical protein